MNFALMILGGMLAAAYFTTKPLGRRGRAGVYAGYLLLYALVFPLLVWLPVYISADFSRALEYPEGVKDKLYLPNNGELGRLPLNADGLIAGEDYRPGVSEKRRVVILGDSFAAGFGLAFGETLGARLQALLGERYQVINGAFFGTNAEMQVEFFFRRLAKYRPEVILIRGRMDDVLPLADTYYLWKAADIMVRYAPLWPDRVKSFIIKRETYLMREKFWRRYQADTVNVIKKNLLEPYDRLGMYAREKGIRVVLMSDSCTRGYEAVCTASAAEAARLNWDLFEPSARADFSAPGMVIPGDGHPSARANLLLARLLHAELAEKHLGKL